jgi:hypothetical protein
MTRDDIIRMAREAKISFGGHPMSPLKVYVKELQHFAALVAAAEREQCALIAESYEPRCDTCPSGVATAIRARGNT